MKTSLKRFMFLVLGAALGICIAGGGLQAASFEVVYADASGQGFYDPTLGQVRRDAFNRALDTWAYYLADESTIRVQAQFASMGGSPSAAILAYAGPTWLYANFSGATASDVWYPAALADAMFGADLRPSDPDLMVVFNSDIDGEVLGSIDWHYDAVPAAGPDVDFQTVAMHEVAHGLGIFGSFRSNGSWGYIGMPTIFDSMLVDASGTRLIDLPASEANVTSPVYFAGPAAVSAYHDKLGGTGNVPIFAPATWRGGSSLSHLDEAIFTGEYGIMSPYYDQTIRQIDDVTLGLMNDLGWHVVEHVPEPATLALLTVGAILIVTRRRRS